MSVLDAQLHIGAESTYGTPVTPTRSFEALADVHTRAQEWLESRGMRGGIQAMRSDRRIAVNMGGAGSLELDAQNKGLGMLLKAAFGTSASAQEGATLAYTQTHSTDAEGPTGESLTVQVGRPMGATFGTTQPFTGHGGKVTNWEISQAVNEILKVKFDLDFEDIDTSTALASAAYPASTTPFHWAQCAVTVDGTATHVQDFRVAGNNSLATDRRFLRSSVLKKEPVRSGLPSFEGSMSAEFDSLTAYERFTAGDIVPVVATWTGDLIEGAHNFKLTVTLPACQFTGPAAPSVSLDSLPSQDLPFVALYDGTDPAVTVELVTTDTTY